MENSDGWMLTCKLCGENHEVPEEHAPYWTAERGALKHIIVGDVFIGCPSHPGKTAQYAFTDFTEYRVAV